MSASEFTGRKITFSNFVIDVREFPRVKIQMGPFKSGCTPRYIGTSRVRKEELIGYLLNLSPATVSAGLFTPEKHFITQAIPAEMRALLVDDGRFHRILD